MKWRPKKGTTFVFSSLFCGFVFVVSHFGQRLGRSTALFQHGIMGDSVGVSIDSLVAARPDLCILEPKRFSDLLLETTPKFSPKKNRGLHGEIQQPLCFVDTRVLSAKKDYQQSEFRRIKNRAFGVGEHLVFEVSLGMLKAGTATMSIPDTQWVNGHPCYHIVTTAESNEFLSKLFKVRDRVESFIDMEGIFTWKFEKHIREGKYRADKYAEYDQKNHVVMTKKDTISIPPYTQDILSSFYYARTVPLKVGKSFVIDNFADGKVYSLKVLVHGKDRIKVPAGKFDCIVVEPILKGEGLFNQKGQMAVWLTDDERRIPVQMKSKVLVGTINVRLKSISANKEPRHKE